MRARILVAALVSLAVVSAALATVLVQRAERPAAQAGEGRALIGGPFALTDHTGRRVSDADYKGRFMLVYFGYTSCPDMCPLGLQVMADALDLVPEPLARRITPIFVTVDPERDTVEAIEGYVGLIHPRLVGLTGTPEEIKAAVRSWRVYVRRNDAQGSAGYLVDHSTFTYLMGPDGAYVTHFGNGTTPEVMAKRLAEALAAGS